MDRDQPEAIGRYRVVRVLGVGAMGRVYLARDPVLDRDVAVKVLRSDLGVGAEHRAGLFDRMRQEARASARVSHPNMVALHDMGEEPELGLFLVFEHVAGETLEERTLRGRLPPGLVAVLARDLGGALTMAHDAGVVHRDIKPANIILASTGAKIADFGIARIPDSTLTREGGGILGTPAYSAPEAIAHGEFSPESDQFSLAATLYEALSGRRAFPGDDAVAVATRIAHEEPPPIADACGLDPHVDSVLERGLAKQPARRFASAAELGAALADALSFSPRLDVPSASGARFRGAAPSRARVARVAVGAVAVGGLVALAISRGTRELGADGRSESPTASVQSPDPPSDEEQPVAWLAERPQAAPKRRTHAPVDRSPDATSVTADGGATDGGNDTGSAFRDAQR